MGERWGKGGGVVGEGGGLLRRWLRLGGSGGRSLGCACGEWVVVSRNMCVSFYVCLCVLWREDGAAAEINAARRAETKLCL